jgi:phosphoribosylformylglycinamidine synthase
LNRKFKGEMRGYHKPIMIAGGLGNIAADHSFKIEFPPGTLLIQLGGPGMLIGLGGGAASSMATGTNTADLDFASVQRGNPEIQRRAQEVIDRCWQMGDDNPILAIHDVGAGGISNAMPELAHGAGCGAAFDLRAVPSEESGMSPREIWCNEAQERYTLAIAPARLDEFRALCERERCPFAVIGTATGDGQLTVKDEHFGNRPVDMSMDVLLGKPPRMHRNAQRKPVTAPALDVPSLELKDAAWRVLRLPAVASKNFLITIGDRSVGGFTARDQMVGPWQVPVADVAVTTLGYDTFLGEAFAMGERTPHGAARRAGLGPHGGGRGADQPGRCRFGDMGGEDQALGQLDGRRRPRRRGCGAVRYRQGGRPRFLPGSLAWRSRWARIRCPCAQNGPSRARAKQVTAPLSLIVTAFAPVADVRRTLTPQLRRMPRSAKPNCC